MSYTCVSTQLHDHGIFHIVLKRPEKLNALNDVLLDELQQCLEHIAADPTIKAVVLLGAGEKAFCAGADIQRLATLTAEQGLQFARQGQAIFRRLETLGKPSIAAVNGYAFGGGCELAMSATLRIASTHAQFSQPEVKLGVIPGYGGTQRLARLVGKGRALEACLTGRMIRAEEALQWGLVSEVVNFSELVPAAHRWLNMILSQAPLAVRSVMEVIDRGYDLPLTEALDLEAIHFGLTCATKDKAEGTSAFLSKRAPTFEGQ